MTDLVDCPFCGLACASSSIDEHVNLHLDDPGGLGKETVPQQPEPITIDSEEAEQEVACQFCGARVDLNELDSHEEAHRLQQLDAEHGSEQGTEEARQFELLQMKYGFSDKRPGNCHRCGKPGHWARECPTNPAVADRGPQQRLTTLPSELSEVQQPDSNPDAGVNVIPLLQACFEAQPKAHSSVYLCGPVGFHGRQLADVGFGCGYRNVQMQASHQLMVGSAANRSLFGGRGVIPNVAALQAWLEVAWQAGFDVSGAAMFGQQLQCSRKWIGASDAAALLRYFGCKALLTEFIARPSTNEAGFTVHQNVECDLCHECPIIGIRHKSLQSPNVDVCNKCRQSPAAQQHAPFVPLGQQPQQGQLKLQQRAPAAGTAAAAVAGGGSRSGGTKGTVGSSSSSSSSLGGQAPAAAAAAAGGNNQRHRALAEWVWAYFCQGAGSPPAAAAAGPPAPPPGGAASAPDGGTSAAAGQSGAAAPAAAAGPAGGASAPDAFAKLMRRHSPVMLTDRPPLFLQHEGHSRTVVGIERCVSPRRAGSGAAAGAGPEYSLVLLDPGLSNLELLRALRSRQGWQRLVKRGIHTLARKEEYQILYVAPEFVPEGPQREALKVLRVADRYTT